jgi:hypothetical protein
VKPWDLEELDEPTTRNGNPIGTTAAVPKTSAKDAVALAPITTERRATTVAEAAGLTAKDDPATVRLSRLTYKGMPLVWKSEETVPEHVFHWNDDPRRHPWCPKCRQREAPKVTFSGTTTTEPVPSQPSDWSVKEVPA